MCGLFDGPDYEPPPPPKKAPPVVTDAYRKDSKAATSKRGGLSALTVDLNSPSDAAGLTL